MNIYFAGDTHGPLNHLAEVPPGSTVIHVGDFSPLGMPLEQALPREIHDRFFWIPGNHDYDSEADYASVFTDFGKRRCFDLKVIQLGDLRIAGMGGIFSGKTWWPKASVVHDDTTREGRLRATPKNERFQGGLSLRLRIPTKPATRSTRSRPVIPIDAGHPGGSVRGRLDYGFKGSVLASFLADFLRMDSPVRLSR